MAASRFCIFPAPFARTTMLDRGATAHACGRTPLTPAPPSSHDSRRSTVNVRQPPARTATLRIPLRRCCHVPSALRRQKPNTVSCHAVRLCSARRIPSPFRTAPRFRRRRQADESAIFRRLCSRPCTPAKKSFSFSRAAHPECFRLLSLGHASTFPLVKISVAHSLRGTSPLPIQSMSPPTTHSRSHTPRRTQRLRMSLRVFTSIVFALPVCPQLPSTNSMPAVFMMTSLLLRGVPHSAALFSLSRIPPGALLCPLLRMSSCTCCVPATTLMSDVILRVRCCQ
ncbi:hypothetical protein TRVL_04016 [Trypanosoma vivax]|nr:hypothetical protein TRVL_04016 [Trypanosoma vivax]